MDEHSARVLRQPALVSFIRTKISAISPELQSEPLVKDASLQLANIEKLVSFPPEKAPTVDDVRKLNEAVGKLMENIQNKTDAK